MHRYTFEITKTIVEHIDAGSEEEAHAAVEKRAYEDYDWRWTEPSVLLIEVDGKEVSDEGI